MQVWKPLALILPAGFVLGLVGGQLARPVMPERAVEPWRSAVQARAQDHQSSAYAAQPQPYVGAYSFAPDTSSTGPDYGPDDWAYGAPLPTVAELDARQAALLADPDVEFAVSPPEELTRATQAALPASRAIKPPADLGSEPRTADGKLPAIW